MTEPKHRKRTGDFYNTLHAQQGIHETQESAMAKRPPGHRTAKGKGAGPKFSVSEMRNKEEEARQREPLLQDEYVAKAQRDKRLAGHGAWHPDRVPEGAQATWISDEAVDLHKLVKGETSID